MKIQPFKYIQKWLYQNQKRKILSYYSICAMLTIICIWVVYNWYKGDDNTTTVVYCMIWVSSYIYGRCNEQLNNKLMFYYIHQCGPLIKGWIMYI